MKNAIMLQVRVFPVVLRDERTLKTEKDIIALTKDQLRAAAIAGLRHTDYVRRLYGRYGYHVQEIGKPTKREIAVTLSTDMGVLMASGNVDLRERGTYNV